MKRLLLFAPLLLSGCSAPTQTAQAPVATPTPVVIVVVATPTPAPVVAMTPASSPSGGISNAPMKAPVVSVAPSPQGLDTIPIFDSNSPDGISDYSQKVMALIRDTNDLSRLRLIQSQLSREYLDLSVEAKRAEVKDESRRQMIYSQVALVYDGMISAARTKATFLDGLMRKDEYQASMKGYSMTVSHNADMADGYLHPDKFSR